MPIVHNGGGTERFHLFNYALYGRRRGPASAEIVMAALSHGCIKLSPARP